MDTGETEFIFYEKGRRIRNDVFPNRWEESSLRNHFSVNEFEQFCLNSKRAGYPIEIGRKVFHQELEKTMWCITKPKALGWQYTN